MHDPEVTQGVVPRISVLVVDVHVRPLLDLAVSDRLTANLVSSSTVKLVLLRTVVLSVLFLVIAVSHDYHALHDQYRAPVFGPGLSQLCRARKLALRPGMCFLIFMFGSPKRTIFTPSPEETHTADFFDSPGVFQGLFKALPLHGPEVFFGMIFLF